MTMESSGNVRILLVEDEKIVAIDLKQGLRMMGFEVCRVVDSGDDAIKAVRWDKPDLVLMDIVLQGTMSGIEAARRILEFTDVPIIYITAHSDEKTFKEAKQTGPYGYILKPVDEKDLKTSIEVALFKFKMEQQLKESRKWFRDIFEQNLDAIVLIRHSDFKLLDANPRTEFLFQYSRQELFDDFSVLFENETLFKYFKEAVYSFRDTHQDSFLDRCRLKKRDGSEIICSIKANAINPGGVEVLYCSIRDITEKVRIEEETRALHSKLLQANKMVSIGTLASGVAHEINNPNNFILSNAQIIEQVWGDVEPLLSQAVSDPDDVSLGGLPFKEVRDVIPRLLLDIIEGSRRIRSITTNLRDFARPADEEVREWASINHVIDFSISMLKNQINTHTDTFSFEPGEDIPYLWGHPQQLEQVMINLIQNALQALPGRGCCVRVTSRYEPRDRTVVVEVADDGLGMEKSVLDRVTDPFFTTKYDNGGTGLGLYISYSIIKSHNGGLEFQSKPGGGTTAIIKLPVGEMEE